jgi:iron complex outermembrane receptor protein
VTPAFSVTLGLRGDRYSTVGFAAAPRGALLFHPTGAGTLKLLYGESFRAPNMFDMNYEDPNAGAKANPGLRPEKVRTGELVYERRLGEHLYSSASAYLIRMRDLIDQRVDPLDGLSQYQNVSRVEARGIELGLDARRHDGLIGALSYSFQRARDLGASLALTNSPEHLLKARCSVPLPGGACASWELIHETGRVTLAGRRTGAHLLANLNLATGSLRGRVRSSLRIRNLFDKRYSLPGGVEHLQDSIPQGGRVWALRMDCRL